MKNIFFLSLLIFSSPALSHVGSEEAHHRLLAGFLHPIGGLDHCLAMIATGLVAAVIAGKARLGLPIAFLFAMLVGFSLAATKIITVPGYELMILASVIGLGLFLLIAKPLPHFFTMLLSAVFGLAHGYAHGIEGSMTSGYVMGFVGATALLHGVGLLLGIGISWVGKPIVYRITGGSIALAGLFLTSM